MGMRLLAGTLAAAGVSSLAPADAVACGAAPRDAVQRFYRAVNDDRFGAAWSCLSTATRSSFGGYARWRAGYAGSISTRLVSSRVTDQAAGTAFVAFRLRSCSAAGSPPAHRAVLRAVGGPQRLRGLRLINPSVRRTSSTVARSCAGGRPPAPRAGAGITVVTRQYFVSRIGRFSPSENPRLSAAIRAFGRPSQRKLIGGTCRVRWRAIGLQISFENFGGPRPGQTTCTPSVGRAQSFVARGTRFRTVRGLRVGAPSSTIPERHPNAEFQSGGFWALVLATFPFGDGDEPAPVLNALVAGGRVAALAGYIGGAGE
jgi:hypothetical protein